MGLPPRRLQNLPGQVQRSRSFDLSPKPPLGNNNRRKPSLSNILRDVVERNVIDTDEEQKNKNGFNKRKITNKSKYVIQHNESEEEEEKEKKSNNNNNNKKAATFQKK